MDLKIPVAETDNIAGGNSAPIVLVEYGDFECPYCKEAYPMIKDLQKDFGENLKFVFRCFPLTGSHPHAKKAASAALAAAKQGKFWQMHDALFENQDRLGDRHLLEYANELGLDIEKFKEDMASGEIAQKVNDEFMGGVRSGVGGTPTFFINGKKLNGSYEKDSIKAEIEAILKNGRG